MKKYRLKELLKAFEALGNVECRKLSYVIMRNTERIKKELIALNEFIKPTEKEKEYDLKRIALCREHSNKNSEGEPITIFNWNQYVFDIKENQVFDEELKTLSESEEYREVVIAMKKKQEEYEKSMVEEDTTIEIYQIKEDDLPENFTPNQILSIKELIM